MSESYFDSAFEQKRAKLENLAGYSFDVDEFLEKRKQLAKDHGMGFSEHVRKYFELYDPSIRFVSGPLLAGMVTLLPEWHHELNGELEVQSIQRSAGFDVDNDMQSQRDLALVFGYWYDCLAHILNEGEV